MPWRASSVACMPFCAISALATDFAAEMAPWRTTSGVGARAPLSASAFASVDAVEPHQARGHGRRREARHHDAVPVAVVVHGVLEPAVDLVADHDRRQHVAAGRAGELGRRQRDRDVVARVAADLAALGVGVVVEVEDADERAVEQHRAGRAGLGRAADHRALRRAAGLRHGRDHRARGFLVERGIAAADGVEQQQLRLMERGFGDVFGADRQRPVGQFLDRTRSLQCSVSWPSSLSCCHAGLTKSS